MDRNDSLLYQETRIGTLALPNRLVRSATWDPSILRTRKMNERVLGLYEKIARGGVGLIITGDFSVVPDGMLDQGERDSAGGCYEQVRIEGFGRLAEAVHRAAPLCKIVAQLSGEYMGVAPSAIASPFSTEKPRPLSADEIHAIVNRFVAAIAGVKGEGFDGVQLHAAHGGMLSRFLSPYSNRRRDSYGGAVENRASIVREILTRAREQVGRFPILIKMNGTDYVPGGTDVNSFPDLAREVEGCGVDAIEISGGMWDCLVRNEQELGFRAVPAAESHTRITRPEQQSYFLPYAEALDIHIPVILAGGNRDVERLEEIVRQGKADLISMCRPLIREPDLPNRWKDGRGGRQTQCISCNSCIYDMWTHVERGEPWVARCLVAEEPGAVRAAQAWLSAWVQNNSVPCPPPDPTPR